MNKGNNSERKILYIVFGFILFFLLIRLPVFGFIASRLLLIGSIALALIFIYQLVIFIREKRRKDAFSKTAEGRIALNLEQCRDLLEDNRKEMEDIVNNIKDLEQKVASTRDITDQHRRESEEVLSAFYSELNLRRAKERFYAISIKKLESLLHNQQLAAEIGEKRKRLRELQENQYEEIARLEEIKSDLESDVFYLETIEELSTRLLTTKTVDDAEHLRLELEEMTRELDEL